MSFHLRLEKTDRTCRVGFEAVGEVSPEIAYSTSEAKEQGMWMWVRLQSPFITENKFVIVNAPPPQPQIC